MTLKKNEKYKPVRTKSNSRHKSEKEYDRKRDKAVDCEECSLLAEEEVDILAKSKEEIAELTEKTEISKKLGEFLKKDLTNPKSMV